MYINPNYLSNQFGIPRFETNSITINTSNVSFTMPQSFSTFRNYSGLILIKFSQSITSGTTTTLPIVLETPSGTSYNITVAGGTDYTVDDYTTGIHLFYYESSTGTLQIIN